MAFLTIDEILNNHPEPADASKATLTCNCIAHDYLAHMLDGVPADISADFEVFRLLGGDCDCSASCWRT